jgi:hypothetical protein
MFVCSYFPPCLLVGKNYVKTIIFLGICQLYKTLFQHCVNILVVYVIWLLCIITFKYQKVPCVYENIAGLQHSNHFVKLD